MTSLSRREFLAGATALSLASAFGRQAPASSAERVVVRLEDEIGLIRPELHGQ